MGGRGRVVVMVNDTRWCLHTYMSYMECVSIVLPLQKLPRNSGDKEVSSMQPDLHSGSGLGSDAWHHGPGSEGHADCPLGTDSF